MSFVIIRTDPVHCAITDGIIGSTSRIDLGGMSFNTEAWAWKKAGLMAQAEWDGCGDASFRVAPADAPWEMHWRRGLDFSVPADDDMPF